MKRVCAVSGKEFEITEDDLAFYERMAVPLPTLSPRERQRRRISYRNFNSLYHRTCSATGKKLISMYDEQVPFPVYDPDYWWSDNWDPRSYAREFDFSRPFFEQYQDLVAEVPRYAIMNLQSENSHYSNLTFQARNCYLIFGCVKNEDCLYGHIVWESDHCLDNLYVYQSQWCSHCVDVVGCYDVHFSTETVNSQESYFLHDCRNCQNCFACTNLRSKRFCFFNEQLSKEKYHEKIKEILPFTWEKIKRYSSWLEEEKKSSCIYPPSFSSQVEDVVGNHLYQSKNLSHCFDTKKSEDSKYCYTTLEQFNCYDTSFSAGPSRFCVDCLTMANSEEIMFSHLIGDSHDIAYSQFCYSSHDLFGCLGLRRGEYAILNKEYPREDYLKLREKIISHMKETGEWGEFFPMEYSPFAYNEAIVGEYFPLSKKEVLSRGWRWRDEVEKPKANGAHVPETIDQAGDDVLRKTFVCEKTGKPYRIIAAELEFSRKMSLPLPRVCPQERDRERMSRRQIRSLWPRSCPRCRTSFAAAFPPQASETVLCEECYLKELG